MKFPNCLFGRLHRSYFNKIDKLLSSIKCLSGDEFTHSPPSWILADVGTNSSNCYTISFCNWNIAVAGEEEGQMNYNSKNWLHLLIKSQTDLKVHKKAR